MSLYTTYKKINFLKGFTAIELMVAVSIMTLLMTVTFSSFSQAQKRARLSRRVADLKLMENSLALYYAVNKSYPNTGGVWVTECTEFNGTGNNVIPGLTPNYIQRIPVDPKSAPVHAVAPIFRPAWSDCYLYISYNGLDYAFLAHLPSDFTQADYMTNPELMDPARDSGTDPYVLDGNGLWAWKVYSPGGVSW